MDIQRVASESAEGKAANGKVSALRDKKLQELQGKNKQLEAAQQKLSQGTNLMSEDARSAAQKEVDRLTVEIQRAQQDADAELQDLTQQLQLDFQRKLSPVIAQVSQERGLQLLLSRADAGIVWADSGLDLTAEIIKRFDAATSGAKPPAKQ
jgi:outer membrane protein